MFDTHCFSKKQDFWYLKGPLSQVLSATTHMYKLTNCPFFPLFSGVRTVEASHRLPCYCQVFL